MRLTINKGFDKWGHKEGNSDLKRSEYLHEMIKECLVSVSKLIVQAPFRSASSIEPLISPQSISTIINLEHIDRSLESDSHELFYDISDIPCSLNDAPS